MSTKPLLVRAMDGEVVERTPVWAMRQAGRWDPDFQKLREGRTFFEFSAIGELAAQASLCPVRFGVDGVILFYDIVTLPIAMGHPFQLIPGRGPVPDEPIRTMADVERLDPEPPLSALASVLDTLRIVRREVADKDDPLAVLVFAGAPFTVATYMIGTGKDMTATRQFMADQPAVWDALLAKLARATTYFLQVLRSAGADAYQVFDSWAGMLTREEYLRQAFSWHEQIFGAVGGRSILFVKDCPWLDLLATSGARGVSLSTKQNLRQAKLDYPKLFFQGNVDHELFVTGQPADIRAATKRCLDEGEGHRHVLNLDHGMDRLAKVENFAAFVDAARKKESRES